MSNAFGTAPVLELLARLKSSVEGFAQRAQRLASDYNTRSSRERQRQEALLRQLAEEHAQATSDLEQSFQRRRTARQRNDESRRARIGRAFQSSKEQRLKAIEDQTGARRYKLQKEMLQAEKTRDTTLAALAAELATFQSELGAAGARLAQLEGLAQAGFKGYGALTRGFLAAYEGGKAPSTQDHNRLLQELQQLLDQAGTATARFNRLFLLNLLRHWWLWALLLGALVPLPLVVADLAVRGITLVHTGAAAGGLFVVLLGLRIVVQGQARVPAADLSRLLAGARHAHDAAAHLSEAHCQASLENTRQQFVANTERLDKEMKQAVSAAGQGRVAARMGADERTVRITARHEELARRRAADLETDYDQAVADLKRAGDAKRLAAVSAFEQSQRALTAAADKEWDQLSAEWRQAIEPIYAELERYRQQALAQFPPWPEVLKGGWRPPSVFAHAARFAQLNVALDRLCDAVPRDPRLALPGPGLALPLSLAYPDEGSVLFETRDSGQAEVVGALNSIILRLLTNSPAGRLNFTIIDPVGLGQNFAGVMHLADYEEQIISNKIWTQSGQIDQRLGELNEHMEKVIQMYLRNEYRDIVEYNRQAGVIAEKFHFLVVADFPSGFTDTAARRLLSIATSGARCGVFTMIHWDQRQPLPQDFIPEELRKSSLCIAARGQQFVFVSRQLPGLDLALDAPPPPDQATELIHQIGLASKDSSRVEVPFEHVAPAADEIWTGDTTKELRVAVGRTGATKLQYLEIGKGTRQHALIAGKTGSGKSTLFHVAITNLSLWCSPEQVEFYLVDFKKGVEFKCYASRRLPHARVVAIESDREFGLSVLQRVDDELKRRGDLFRDLGVQDIPGYKRVGGKEPMPRSLLIIDEFQELFVEDDRIAQSASLLLDRIVRQGRAFGIHVLLGSQTLGGAYTVARTTLGQMVVRIALQCNEADSYLIMDDSNPAPRLLSRPGEGIYNDAAGAVEGNSPFQVVWLPDQVRDEALGRVRARVSLEQYPGPIVFEGNAPADVRENLLLQAVLKAPSIKPTLVPRFWLGAPNSIKGPTEAVFQRQSGNNLLMVGQRDEAILAILSTALVALAAQFRPGGARFILCDTTPPGSAHREYLDQLAAVIPHGLERVKAGDLDALMQGLNAEMKMRAADPEAETAPPRFLFVHGIQKLSRLRFEEDYSFSASDSDAPSPGTVLNQLICEGTRLGYHVIITCDTYNNVNRFMSRKAVSEMEMRVLFQMSANDSASLIDNPKASTLGLHRALFYNAQESHLETFRPYALPPADWVQSAGRELARLSA